MAGSVMLMKYEDEKMSLRKEGKNAKVYASFKHIKHNFLREIIIFHIAMTFSAY